MYRYFIHLGFKGTHYHGWQVQPGSETVQGILNESLSMLLRENIYCIGAGRTDSGVHAPCFYAHFDSQQNDLHLDSKVIYKLNCILPRDIAVYKIIDVPNDAHARFSAISRTYLYRLSQLKDPFNLEFTMFMSKKIEIEKMNVAAEILKIYTDFTSFSKLHTDVKTNNCNVTYAKWTIEGTELHFTISADRFLRNMVRAIVGTLLEIGLGKMTPDCVRAIIEKKNRSEAGTSVDASGLHLIKIQYPDNIISNNPIPY
ncbi:MAG TPA: tRNA pseudouridine(38-40) synthase TruA [Bacteroidales bacterium]